MFVALYLR